MYYSIVDKTAVISGKAPKSDGKARVKEDGAHHVIESAQVTLNFPVQPGVVGTHALEGDVELR